MLTFSSQPIKEDTTQRIFNMKSSIKHNMLWDLFLNIFLKKEGTILEHLKLPF